jgi:CheY-like chemotaxis protein
LIPPSQQPTEVFAAATHFLSAAILLGAGVPNFECSASEQLRLSLAGKTVLVAEDTWHVAKALKGVLEEMGLVVVGPAASIRQALELLGSSSPDFAIVDINLKGEFSYPLIERLKARDVPVIVITGYAQLTEPIKGATAILQKPFSGLALLSKVSDTILRRSDT